MGERFPVQSLSGQAGRTWFELGAGTEVHISHAQTYVGVARVALAVLILALINFVNFWIKNFRLKDYRIIDKTPPNIFRVDYLARLYPDAKFIYLTRDANENVSSLISAWCHKKKFKYSYRDYLGGKLELKDCMSPVWKFYIPEDFSEDKYFCEPVEEVCIEQWLSAHKAAQESFAKMDKEKYIQVKFEDLLSRPDSIMQEICDFIEVDYSDKLKQIVKAMPASNTDTNFKTKKKKVKILKGPELEAMQARLGYNQDSYVI